MKTALDLRAVAILVILCGSWGLNQVAIKVALSGIPPALQMGARSGLAALLVFGWCAVRGKRLFQPDGSLWPGLAAGLLFGAEFLAIFWGLQYTTAARGVIFIYLSPFVVALGGHFLLHEPLGIRKLVGLTAAFLGLVLAFFDELSLPSQSALFGDALCMLAALLWGATTVLIKGSVLREVSAEKTLLYQLAVSALFGLATSVLIGERIGPDLGGAVMPAFLYQAVWVAAITYVAWFALIRDYPASLLSSFTFLTPLFGVAFGAALLGEPLSARLLAALLLVAAGIYLVNRNPARVEPPQPSQQADADAAA
jgi:drug/metabolite transporter (DMT)-like permease